jgi:copper transport protein
MQEPSPRPLSARNKNPFSQARLVAASMSALLAPHAPRARGPGGAARRPRRAYRTWLLAGMVALVLAAVLPGASGHASFVASMPAAGQHLERVPDHVMVTVSERIDPRASSLTVTNSAGERVDLGDLQVENGPQPVLQVHLRPGLPDDAYTIHWRVLSTTDGHPTSGSVGFAVGAFEAPASGGGEGDGANPAGALARAAAYAGFSLVFGALAILGWLRPAPRGALVARRALFWGATLLLGGTVALTHDTLHRAGLAWADAEATSVGRVLLTRIGLGAAAWALTLASLLRPLRAAPWLAGLAAAASALLSARHGHASGAGPAAVAIDFLHLLAADPGAGGLGVFLVAARHEPEPARLQATGIRFGTLALVLVTVLWFAGLVVGLTILGPGLLRDPVGALSGPYGLFLAGKLALTALMVGFAAVNRFALLGPPGSRLGAAATRLTRGRLRPVLESPRPFRRLLATEATVGAAILVLAGLLTSVSPPQADAGPAPLLLRGQGDAYVVHAILEPPPRVASSSMLHLAIEDAQGRPLLNNTCGNDACVRVMVDQGGYGPETHTATPAGGYWMVHSIVWAHAGNATLRITVSSAEVFRDEVVVPFTVAA